jgi:hypothetical protein
VPDFNEEQACERLNEVVEAVLWDNDDFMHWLEMLARIAYDEPADVTMRMTRLWYAYCANEVGKEEIDADCPNCNSTFSVS